MQLKAALTSLALLAHSALSSSQTPLSAPPLHNSAWHPTKISAQLEVAGTAIKASTTYSLALDPSPAGDDVSSWMIALPGAQGWLEARQLVGGSRDEVSVELVRSEGDLTYYSIPVHRTSASTTATVVLTSVTSHQTVPHPATLPQTAQMMTMQWSSDLQSYIAGLSSSDLEALESLSVKFKAPSPRLGDIVTPEGFGSQYTKGGSTVTFTRTASEGSFSSLKEEGSKLAQVSYHQTEALAAIRTVERVVEVSHWGSNLATQDNVQLYNAGAKLQGNFARIDHQKAMMQRRLPAGTITSLSLVLPPRVFRPYYYDLVGNVSTSNFRSSDPPKGTVRLPSSNQGKTSHLELRPRYPLMGGWNFTFTVGYDAPLQDSVRSLTTQEGKRAYVLRVPFLTAIKDVAVDDATVRILLPEGSRNIKVHAPFPLDTVEIPQGPGKLLSWAPGYTKSYLDSTGHPTVVLKKKNCTDRHGADVLITYELSFFAEWVQKPVMVAAVVSSLYAATMFVKRIEWAI